MGFVLHAMTVYLSVFDVMLRFYLFTRVGAHMSRCYVKSV